jgi:integrase
MKLELTNPGRPISALRARATIGGERVTINTGIKLPPSLWLRAKQQVSLNLNRVTLANMTPADVDLLNLRVNNFRMIYAHILNEETSKAMPGQPSAQVVKERVEKGVGLQPTKRSKPKQDPEQPNEPDEPEGATAPDLIAAFKTYVREGSSTRWDTTMHNEPLKPGTVKKYTATITKLQAFADQGASMKLQDVSIEWYRNFVQFLTGLNYSDNTISKHVACLKAVLRWMEEAGHQVNPDYRSSKFRKLKPRRTHKPTITPDELRQLMAMELQGKLEKTRDLLVIGCWTALRVSDLMKLGDVKVHQDGKHEFIRLETTKTGTTVEIPLHEHVRQIRARWGGWPPTISEQKFNEYAKQLCKQAGMDEPMQGEVAKMITQRGQRVKRNVAGTYAKWELISSHTCRRSFATNFYASNALSAGDIMQITGHATEAQFLEYIHTKPADLRRRAQEAMERM